MNELLVITLGYVIGSVPFAFLVARRHGIDLRRVGSLNVGASNVLRTSGVSDAIFAMALDASKGALAVLVAQRLGADPGGATAAGVASILGHVYPVWLGFRGGKGVATAAGVFGVLAPVALGFALAVFLIVVWLTRYISAASVAGTITLLIAAPATSAPAVVAIGVAAAAAVIVFRHRGNVGRLLAGTERRVGR